ncbi:5564_t:CDS:2 [Ambispora leptoticha]|uniref:Histone H1 n=1 Tax=Ambispora leptoticha TaxID=144679 RepID=A0A9N9FC30_9GLOM|nr:5564_t:CDS:2 [Ambispora leptoticha]
MTEAALTSSTNDKSITDFESTTGLQTPDKSDQQTSESDQHTPRSMINTRSPYTNNSNGTRSPNTSKGSGANGEEWGDEDGDFELEDDISPTSQASRDTTINTNLEVNNNLSSTPSFPTPPETTNVEVVAQSETPPIQDDDTAGVNQFNSVQVNLTTNESNISQQQSSSHHEELITKFGRKVSKPIHYSPNAPKPSRGSKATNKTTSKSTKKSSTKSSGSSKRQRREPSPVVAEDVLCSICQEGQSPKHNRIVLCDSCDTPFHQQCHVPNIDDYVTEVRDASWYCLKCENERQANKKRKIESSENQPSTGETGKNFTEEQKKQYLQTLSSDTLVKLLLFAETLHPDLPIYPHNFKDIVDQLSHPVPEVVIDSTDQARAIEAQSNVNLSSSFGSVPARSSISPTPTPSASTVQSNLLSQFSPVHEKSFSIPRHHSYLSTTSQEQPSAMHAHLPPSTTLIQAPQSSTFAFSLTTLSTSPNTIRAPQSLLPSPTTANLPSYEEMIVEAITAIADPNGVPPKAIFDRMESTYPLHSKFRSSASQALHKAVKKGRVLKVGLTLYKLNSDYTAPAKNARRLHRKTSVASSISDNHSVTSAILPNYNGYEHNNDNEVMSSPNAATTTDDPPSNMDIELNSNSAGVDASEVHQERSISAFAAYNGSLSRQQTLTQHPPTLPPLSSVAGTAYMPFSPGNGYNGGHVGALH